MTYYAVRSEQQREWFQKNGHDPVLVEYRKPDGTTVICTEVSTEPGVPSCKYPDKIDLGEVTEYVRSLPGSSSRKILPDSYKF